MAKKATQIPESDEFAQQLIDKIGDQIEALMGRNWPEISKIIKDDEEIKMTIGVHITDRTSTPGEQAAADNRVKSTLAFSVRFSDAIENDLPDPAQPELIE